MGIKKNNKTILNEPTEHQMQCAVFDIIRRFEHRYLELQSIYAIPNGAKLPYGKTKNGVRYSKEASWLLDEGMRPGVPDICCPYSNGTFNALYIEMKRPSNKPTPSQERMIPIIEGMSNLVVICYSAKSALNNIFNYTIQRLDDMGLTSEKTKIIIDLLPVIKNL